MERRTDLALEARELHPDCEGVTYDESREGDVVLSRMRIDSAQASSLLERPVGAYITVQLPALTDSAFLPDERYTALSRELSALLPKKGLVLVAGLGNETITPDALGPRTASLVLATRHITEELKRSSGFDRLRPCAVITPGVLGQTGIEANELIASVCAALRPSAVIAIDALASRRLSRLGCTVQLSDTGISPGAGVGNNRPALSEDTLGVPVIALGVPTVVEASTLAADLMDGELSDETANAVCPRGCGMIVTPREIDLLITRAARLLALAVNHALHPTLDPVELMSI